MITKAALLQEANSHAPSANCLAISTKSVPSKSLAPSPNDSKPLPRINAPTPIAAAAITKATLFREDKCHAPSANCLAILTKSTLLNLSAPSPNDFKPLPRSHAPTPIAAAAIIKATLLKIKCRAPEANFSASPTKLTLLKSLAPFAIADNPSPSNPAPYPIIIEATANNAPETIKAIPAAKRAAVIYGRITIAGINTINAAEIFHADANKASANLVKDSLVNFSTVD